MALDEEDVKALSYLLKASSKKHVLELCRDTHKVVCGQKTSSTSMNKKIMANLPLTEKEASQLARALEHLIRHTLFHNFSTAEEIGSVFPDSFHNNLKELLVRIFVECTPEWRAQCLNSAVSLPRLVDLNYRVDWKTASDNSEQFTVPTCILDLQVSHSFEVPSEIVSVELSREKLDTMLHGLARIRDQLSAVAKK